MQEYSQEELNKALSKCKIALMSTPDSAFFTSVVFSLKHEFDNSIPTACTNGYWIKYSPEFFMKQSLPKRVGLMLHEVLHVVFMHMGRLKDKDMTKWNYATDFVINLILVERGFELPAGGLLDRQYKGLSAEEVYEMLPDTPPEEEATHFVMPEGEEGSGESSPDTTQGSTAPMGAAGSGDQEAEEALERHIQDILVRAQTQSQLSGDKPGTIPGEIEFYLDRLLRPKLPTGVLLKRFISGVAKNDYTWRRPNKRHFPNHYLPSLYNEALDHVAIAVDASGSVTDAEFLRFVSEAAGVFRTVKPKKISLITFDSMIRQVDVVRNVRELAALKFKGRGGTAIRPVLDWAVENRPKVMMVFSDGQFYFHSDTPKVHVPILWCIHNMPTFTAPMGKVVHYELE